MLAFHNNAAIKERYLERVKQHALADAIVQGVGWENGKGGAIGCTLEGYDHERYPIELGIPVELAHLEEQIFEGLLHLRRLRSRGWPLEVYLTPADNSIKGGVMTIVTCRMEKFSIGVVLDDQGIDPEVFRAIAILREFIEGEIERRGLWKRYLEAITTRSAPSQNGKGVLRWRDTEHRPTLLEVLKAAVEVADG